MISNIIIKLSVKSDNNTLIVDPHTAIGLGAIIKVANANKDSGVALVNTISLATAHPAKFPEAMSFAYGGVELPKELKHVMKEKENFDIMDNSLNVVKNYILKKI